jgi:hypothetical protein
VLRQSTENTEVTENAKYGRKADDKSEERGCTITKAMISANNTFQNMLTDSTNCYIHNQQAASPFLISQTSDLLTSRNQTFAKSEQLLNQKPRAIAMSTLTKQLIQEIETLPPQLQQEALDFIEFLKLKQSQAATTKTHHDDEPNGAKLARLMEEASKKNLFADIKDPSSWQREIRKDRPLSGRE